MYSPGSLNFAVTLVFPEYGCATCPPEMVSTFGLPSAGSKVTVPGPRYFEKIVVTGGGGFRIGALVPLVNFASSLTQSGSGIGALTVAVRATALAIDAIGP